MHLLLPLFRRLMLAILPRGRLRPLEAKQHSDWGHSMQMPISWSNSSKPSLDLSESSKQHSPTLPTIWQGGRLVLSELWRKLALFGRKPKISALMEDEEEGAYH